MNQINTEDLKQLNSYREVETGDTIICVDASGYMGLANGKPYKVVASYPNPYGFYNSDYVEVVGDKDMRVKAHIRRFAIINKKFEVTTLFTNGIQVTENLTLSQCKDHLAFLANHLAKLTLLNKETGGRLTLIKETNTELLWKLELRDIKGKLIVSKKYKRYWTFLDYYRNSFFEDKLKLNVLWKGK